MKVASDPRLSNKNHGSLLPPSWRTLYELTKLSDEEFAAGIENGLIHAGLERKEVNKLLFARNRDRRHQEIAAKTSVQSGDIGTFPLIYADPPWKFEAYSKEGTDRTPEKHYPTLTEDELLQFPVEPMAEEDCHLTGFPFCIGKPVARP
jgi:hypothetical protein